MKFLKRFFTCGRRSLHRETEPEKKCNSYKRRRAAHREKNPFSSRGIDKFYDLMAEHDRKKMSIYLKKGSENIAAVRFFYSDSSNVATPVVIKYMDRQIEKEKRSVATMNNSTTGKDSCSEKPKNRFEELLKEPRYYLPIVILLILVFLAIFDRPSAVLFTFIAWCFITCFAGVAEEAQRP